VDWVLRVRVAIARFLKKQPLGDGRSPQNTLRLRRLLRQNPIACQLLFKRRRSELQAEYLQDRLMELHQPILLLQGEQDTSNTITLTQMYAQAPHATVEVIPVVGSPDPWTQNRNPGNSSTILSDLRAEYSNHEAIAPVIHQFLKSILKSNET
jgi:pimeloyl-ACP methyl ester carboxylesterase